MNRLDVRSNLEMTRRLYRAMPGAPFVPIDADSVVLWGEVEGTPHYEFCEQITAEIMQAARDAFFDAIEPV